ncbi:MAG: NACHT domain-containing NTPase, partial [Crocosphaera sp.]
DQETKAFLVLGDPGSGKSVALRQLARELLEEVPKTGKIPVYLNLREWRVREKWSKTAKPTVEQLQTFLLKHLQKSPFLRDFLDRKVDQNSDETMFSKLFKDGRFFLILDSFDEIPQVLDENEKSWLISELSEVIYRFLVVGHECRGVLSSRLFRCPDINFNAETVLEVRPFSEAQIYSYLIERRSLYDKQTVKRLLVERANLVPAFRNPFTLGLIPLFSRLNPNQFPDNQNQLYETFLEDRLELVEGEINERNRNRENLITKETIIDCAKKIAFVLFDNDNFGFEAPLRELIQVLSNQYGYEREDIEDIIGILESAAIIRMGLGRDRLFSFVHRRFAEYLVAKTLEKKGLDELPIESIPKDTRWREALVLYCEVTDKETATQIAEYCWERVKLMKVYSNKMNTPEFLESIHSLRFLTTAFRSRLDCIKSFQDRLNRLLSKTINRYNNILSVKFSVEALGLLKPKDTTNLIIRAFNFNNDWISETAIYACRSLPSLDNYLEKEIKRYVVSIPNYEFISNIKESLFYFGLSDSFRNIYNFCRLRLIEITLYYVLFLLMLMTINLPVLPFFLILFYYNKIFWRLLNHSKFIMNFLPKFNVLFLLLLFFYMELINIIDNYSTFSVLSIFDITNSFNILYISLFSIGLLFIALCLLINIYIFYNLMYHDGQDDIYIILSSFVGMFLYISHSLFTRFISSSVTIVNMGFALFLIISLILVLGTLLSGFIKVFIPFITNWNHDRKQLRKLLKKSSDPYFVWTKQEISKQFLSLKTASGRLKFVEHLEEKRVKPLENSDWPNGNLPNVNNDQASTLLAKLEERWLGLNR